MNAWDKLRLYIGDPEMCKTFWVWMKRNFCDHCGNPCPAGTKNVVGCFLLKYDNTTALDLLDTMMEGEDGYNK